MRTRGFSRHHDGDAVIERHGDPVLQIRRGHGSVRIGIHSEDRRERRGPRRPPSDRERLRRSNGDRGGVLGQADPDRGLDRGWL